MKKSLWIVLLLALICTLAFSACDDTNQPQTPNEDHVHAFGEWTTVKDATSTVKGEQERICSCGEKETQSIDATGHTEVVDAAVAATCTTDGKSEGKHCSVCSETLIAQNNIPASHTDGEWKIDTNATCTEDGTKHQVCAVCSASIKTGTIAATGHTDGAWITDADATCTVDGSKHQVCSVCNATIKTEAIAAKGHIEIIDAYIAATCTTEGKTEGTHCSRCNTVLVAQTTISELGHTEIIDVAIPVTCVTDGMTEGSHCSVCETVFIEQEIIKSKGHNYQNDYEIDCFDTLTCSGEKSRHCSHCNARTDVTKFHATIVNGILNDEQLHWKKEYSPYCITGNILVETGKTLNIEPGVEIYVNGKFYLQIEGVLQAIGSEDNNICFYGIGDGYNTWEGIKVVASDLVIEGEKDHIAYKSGSHLKYTNIYDCAGGLKGEFFIDSCIISTSEWAIGQSTRVDSRFTGVVKNSIIIGKIDVDRGHKTAFINCSISTPYFISASEVDEKSKIEFYGCLIEHKDDKSSSSNGYFEISSNISWAISTNIFAQFENTDIIGFSFFYVTATDSLIFKNCNINNIERMLFSYGKSSSTVDIQCCHISQSKLEFSRYAKKFSQNNLEKVSITIYSSRQAYGEIDMKNNYWGENNLEELQAVGLNGNLSFIIDFYDDFNKSKVIYDEYAVKPFAGSGNNK